jgi:hypothetical protein
MTETDDDVVASWHDRVGTLRKRGRISGDALTIIPAGPPVRPPLRGFQRPSGTFGSISLSAAAPAGS